MGKINVDGSIKIPDYIRYSPLESVEIIILLQGEKKDNQDITNFYNLIEAYNKIDEPELDIDNLYLDRNEQSGRKFDFN